MNMDSGFFVYFKLSGILLGIHDPFAPFENLFCAMAMGGIWDALRLGNFYSSKIYERKI